MGRALTFLFTDIEGSTALWAEHTAAMDRAIAHHDTLMRDSIERHGGTVFGTAGDSFAAIFVSAGDAVAAARAAQLAMQTEPWPELPDGLRVRMGLHCGPAFERGGDYFGPEVNTAARVMAAAWGEQILCSESVAPAAGVTKDLGAHRLRDVPGRHALHQVLDPELRTDFPAPRTIDDAPSTLPAQRSSFVGRRDEIDAVERLLAENRLVTLTGPGGIGKTRLAVEVAGRLAPQWDGGTFFADLAPLEHGDHVDQTVVRACLLPPDSGRKPADQLADALAGRTALLIIDNCEHVIDNAAELADRLLDDCPKLRVLATSREALELRGERVYAVGPLDTSSANAQMLFVVRSAAVDGMAADPTGHVIDEICARLDGIPLAIELAAARTRTLSPTQVRDRLDAQLDVLVTRRRGVPDRHLALRATIDWSYQLLAEDEQQAFARLAAFAGSFDLRAAAYVFGCNDRRAAELLDSLVVKSMVATVDTVEDRRFRLLDSMRAFADERLLSQPDEQLAAKARHREHFVQLLCEVRPSRFMATRLGAELEHDLENLRSALDQAPLAGTALPALVPFAFLLANMGLLDEAGRRCRQALTDVHLDDAVRSRLLFARAFVEGTQDGTGSFGSLARVALEGLHPGDGMWAGALGMTSVPMQLFAPLDVLPQLEEAEAQLQGISGTDAEGDRAMLGFFLGSTLMNARRFEEGTGTLEQSAARLAAVEPTSIVRIWSAAGSAIGHVLLGRVDAALLALAQVEELIGWTDWDAEWAFAMALAQASMGRTEDARELLSTFGARLGSGGPSPIASTIVAGFGVLAEKEGRHGRARELFSLLTATRQGASTAAMYEVLGRLDGWDDADFANHKIEHVIGAMARETAMERAQYFARLAALVREEIEAADSVR